MIYTAPRVPDLATLAGSPAVEGKIMSLGSADIGTIVRTASGTLSFFRAQWGNSGDNIMSFTIVSMAPFHTFRGMAMHGHIFSAMAKSTELVVMRSVGSAD